MIILKQKFDFSANHCLESKKLTEKFRLKSVENFANASHKKSTKIAVFLIFAENSASPKCSDSENNPIKNFYRAHYKLINTKLDIDWDQVIDSNVELILKFLMT